MRIAVIEEKHTKCEKLLSLGSAATRAPLLGHSQLNHNLSLTEKRKEDRYEIREIALRYWDHTGGVIGCPGNWDAARCTGTARPETPSLCGTRRAERQHSFGP